MYMYSWSPSQGNIVSQATSGVFLRQALPKEVFGKVAEMLAEEIDAHRARGLNPNHPHARGTAQCDDIYFQALSRGGSRVSPRGIFVFFSWIIADCGVGSAGEHEFGSGCSSRKQPTIEAGLLAGPQQGSLPSKGSRDLLEGNHNKWFVASFPHTHN